jgi:hypothetical protein
MEDVMKSDLEIESDARDETDNSFYVPPPLVHDRQGGGERSRSYSVGAAAPYAAVHSRPK